MPKKLERDNSGANGPTSGPNNPKEAVEITAGTPKKRETYEQRAREGKDPDSVAQHSKPKPSTRDHRTPNGLRIEKPASRRSGSDSNAGGG